MIDRNAIASKLAELMGLPDGWDGYRAGPIAPDTARLVWRVLDTVCTDATPQPHLVPGSDGSVQIEWHDPVDIELQVMPDGSVSVLIDEEETAASVGDIAAVANRLPWFA